MMVRLGEIHPLGTKVKIIGLRTLEIKLNQEQNEGAYYFHAKSLMRHKPGNTTTIPQKTGEVIKKGRIPVYSVEKLSIGATVEYAGMKIIQMTIEPGIAMTVYFVHMLHKQLVNASRF